MGTRVTWKLCVARPDEWRGGSQGYTKKGMNDWRMARGENRKTNERDPMAFIIKIQLFSAEVYQNPVDAHAILGKHFTHTHTTEIASKVQAGEEEVEQRLYPSKEATSGGWSLFCEQVRKFGPSDNNDRFTPEIQFIANDDDEVLRSESATGRPGITSRTDN